MAEKVIKELLDTLLVQRVLASGRDRAKKWQLMQRLQSKRWA